jgi:peptidase M28-like protein
MLPRLLPAFVLAAGIALAAQAPARIDPSRFLAHVKWLSSDELGGRGNGTEALDRAAAYIRDRFRDAGLDTVEQPFDTEVSLEPPASATLVVDDAGKRRELALGRDYYPLSLLDRTPVTPPPEMLDVPVVFAGYGISAPAMHYDDYARVDVRDTAVVVLTHEPQELDPGSRFDGRNLTPGAAIAQKAREARERGARLLIVIEDPVHATDPVTRAAWWTDPQADTMVIPVVRIARSRISSSIPELDFAKAAAAIDRTLQPQSRRIESARISYVEYRARFTARLHNIVGVRRGADPALAGEAVVIGAHYDHIGSGGSLSESPQSAGQVHNGADDNASGVAAILEMARAVSGARLRLRRTLVFAAFAGEELGLRGSEQYADAPAVPLAQTRAMINLDMVGRAHGRVHVGVFGAGAGPPLLPRLRQWTQLSVQDFEHGGYSLEESDVGPFVRRGVPAIAFFTGFHADYHRPTDDWPAIDAAGGAAVAELALKLIEDLAR